MNGPLKWHGGKHYLAKRIAALAPPHLHYVEPFFGGGAVLLAKDPEGVSEVVNDLNGELIGFWRTLQSTAAFEKFRRIIEAVPFSEREFHEAALRLDGEGGVNTSIAFFIRCRQSLAGRMNGFTGVTKTRTRRGMNNEVSAWLSCIEGLPAVHARLRRVLILNRPALEVIAGQDGEQTLFYCDPPYLHETRVTTGEYAHEMSEADHVALLAALRECRGKVMLSGYPSELYDKTLADWTRHVFELPNQASGAKTKRRVQEVLWCNF